jgi:hypothetical protein
MKPATYFSDGAAERTRTSKRHFESLVEMSRKFSLADAETALHIWAARYILRA